MVGCTNGQVYRLKLQWEGLAADAKGVGDLAADVAIVGCAGGFEQTVVTVIDTIPIWAKADAIPVYCLASYCRVREVCYVKLLVYFFFGLWRKTNPSHQLEPEQPFSPSLFMSLFNNFYLCIEFLFALGNVM